MTADIHQQKILILDFGSQYTQLIARRIREIGVYCEIHPWDMDESAISEYAPRGIVLAGGMESMTRSPYLLPKARGGYRMGHGEVLDHMFYDGLQNPDDGLMMGAFGERCAEEFNFTREQQDAFAIASIERAGGPVVVGVFEGQHAPPAE